jgi:signal transduction histidine kinase
MINLDVGTASFILAVMYLALPGMVWVTLSAHKVQSLQTWCSAGVAFALSFAVMAFEGVSPAWLAIPVQTGLFFSGVVLHIQALRIELHKPLSAGLLMSCIGAFIVLQTGAVLLAPTSQLQMVASYIVYFVYYVATAYLIFTTNSLSEMVASRGVRWIGHACILVLISLAIRQIAVFSGGHENSNLSYDLSMYVLALFMAIAAVAIHIGYIGFVLDRSALSEKTYSTGSRKLELRRQLNLKLSELDRKRSIGALGASLGHEISQPLTVILTVAQVAGRGVKNGRVTGEEAVEHFEKIAYNTQRAKKIVERIRGYDKRSESSITEVDLAKVVDEAMDLVMSEATLLNVQIITTPTDEVFLVLADPLELTQILVNIIRNGIDALKENEKHQRRIHIVLLAQTERVILRIRDNGPGLQSEVMGLVGRPLFTTKSGALGMGLCISRTITEEFGGTLKITNDMDGGALVELNFPAMKGASTLAISHNEYSNAG